jgi:hypothetical protein
LENENQSIFNIITHDTANNESNRLASCTVPEHVSSFRESSVSVCVEGNVVIPEPPDMNPIKHLWDYLGRKVNARTTKCQNIQELGTALVQGWPHYPQHRLRRLIHGMKRRVQELYRMRDG